MIPSGNLTLLWKITIFNGKIHYKSPFSVKLPEGTLSIDSIFGNPKRHAVRRHSLRALEYLLKREARVSVMFLAGLVKDTLCEFHLGMEHGPFSLMTDLLNMVIFQAIC